LSHGAWDVANKDSLKLVVIDFQNILGVINKEIAPCDAPYFVDFSKKLKKLEHPAVDTLGV